LPSRWRRELEIPGFPVGDSSCSRTGPPIPQVLGPPSTDPRGTCASQPAQPALRDLAPVASNSRAPKCHPWVTLWVATGSNTRVTLCNRVLDSAGLRSIEPSGLLKRDIARRHSGGYQGSHPPKTAIQNPATALPARLRAGLLEELSSRPNARPHRSQTHTHGPKAVCASLNPRSRPAWRTFSALSVPCQTPNFHRTLTPLFAGPPGNSKNYRLPDFTLLLPYFRITIPSNLTASP
jgi:hypothetical protein